MNNYKLRVKLAEAIVEDLTNRIKDFNDWDKDVINREFEILQWLWGYELRGREIDKDVSISYTADPSDYDEDDDADDDEETVVKAKIKELLDKTEAIINDANRKIEEFNSKK